MEGYLYMYREKKGVLGRAMWKTRYVVLSPEIQSQDASTALSRQPTNDRRRSSNKELMRFPTNSSSTDANRMPSDTWWLQVFKEKEDMYPDTCIPVPSIRACALENVPERKAGSIVPTLAVTIELRAPTTSSISKSFSSTKRWSGQTGNPASSSSDSQFKTFYLRKFPEDRYNLNDWQENIIARLKPMPQFQNTEPARMSISRSGRPSISSRNIPSQPPSSYQSSGFVPSVQFSAAGSVRSMRSDLSSSASDKKSMFSRASDLPSPALDMPVTPKAPNVEHRLQIRPNSPTRSSPMSASIPRESILDRAFAMKCVPGSEAETSTNLSSVARFEALMAERETDRKRHRIKERPGEESEEEKEGKIPSATMRALEFISRRSPQEKSGGGDLADPSRSPSVRGGGVSRRASQRRATVDMDGLEADQRSRSGIGSPTAGVNNKHLSLTDFTRRVSATGSTLLRTQTETNSNSSRRSSGLSTHSDDANYATAELDGGTARLSATPAMPILCWRGSVGVFGERGGAF